MAVLASGSMTFFAGLVHYACPTMALCELLGIFLLTLFDYFPVVKKFIRVRKPPYVLTNIFYTAAESIAQILPVKSCRSRKFPQKGVQLYFLNTFFCFS